MNNYFFLDLKQREKDEEFKKRVNGFIATIDLGDFDKTDLEEFYQKVSNKIFEYRRQLNRLKDMLEKWEGIEINPRSGLAIMESKFHTKAELIKTIESVENELKEWSKLGDELNLLRNKNKNFNKSICFSNIRELLKENTNVKIGQIEREAGIRLGYMSRLEKEDNTAEPSMEFIVTAAKLLNVSIDTLITYDIAELTPSERYLLNFIEKLKVDTLKDKLNWVSETKLELERHETDFNGKSTHPLLTLEDFYVPSDCEYPEKVTENIYVSKTYELATIINDDSYSLRLKNGATLFLMNVKKRSRYTVNNSKEVVEAVMFVPNGRTQVIATTNDEYPVSKLLDDLYKTVKEHLKHPQVNKDAMYAIDAFMKDDLTDDPEELPF